MINKTRWESFKADGDQMVEKLKAMIREGNVRRVLVEHEHRTIAEFPLTAGVVGVLLAPALAAIGVLIAMTENCTIRVEREQAQADPPGDRVHAA
jgi:Domain of unknown function (DUF4342)